MNFNDCLLKTVENSVAKFIFNCICMLERFNSVENILVLLQCFQESSAADVSKCVLYVGTYLSLQSTCLLKVVSMLRWSLERSRTAWWMPCNSLFISSANRTVDFRGFLLRLAGEDTSYSLSLCHYTCR